MRHWKPSKTLGLDAFPLSPGVIEPISARKSPPATLHANHVSQSPATSFSIGRPEAHFPIRQYLALPPPVTHARYRQVYTPTLFSANVFSSTTTSDPDLFVTPSLSSCSH